MNDRSDLLKCRDLVATGLIWPGMLENNDGIVTLADGRAQDVSVESLGETTKSCLPPPYSILSSYAGAGIQTQESHHYKGSLIH